MAKYIYPAIFTKEDNGLYSILFPDLDGCFTQGSSVEDGMYMAMDVLSIVLCDMEDDKKEIPKPTEPMAIQVDNDSFVTLICADTAEYRKIYNGKSVKKTLTIPQWLNDAAIRENVNFSQTLQNALKEQLHLK